MLMLQLCVQYNFSEDSLTQCNLSNAVRNAIVHEDVSVFERFIALLEHWASSIQHENTIRSLASSVFAVY